MQTTTHSIDISALGRDKRSLSLANEQVAIEVPDLSLFYGQKQALHNVSMNIPRQRVTAFIGPSGCGKSTLLRCFNRMNDLVDGCRIEGAINLAGQNIYQKGVDVADLRRRGGMVFQTLPSARSVIPIRRRQEGATSGWMYIARRRRFDRRASPRSSGFASARGISRWGMSAPAGTEFM